MSAARDDVGDWAYIYPSRSLTYVPATRFHAQEQGHTYHPFRGSPGQVAVFVEGRCAGWMSVDVLGFDSVTEWMKTQPAERQAE